MTESIQHARLSIDGAKRRLAEVREAVAGYLATKPWEFQTDQQGGTLTVKEAVKTKDPPESLRIMVGGCLGDLRPVFDYLAWGLVSVYAPTPPVVGIDHPQFPIASDPAKFRKQVRNYLGDYPIPADVLDTIESVQPYQPGYEVLGAVNALVNQHKHCLPVLIVTYLDNTSIQVSAPIGKIETCVLQPPGSMAQLITHNPVGMIVRRLTPEDLDANGDFDIQRLLEEMTKVTPVQAGQQGTLVVDGDVTFFVSIKHELVAQEPVEQTLERMIAFVEGIVPRFEPYLAN
jgi:hypothetical protein